MKLKFICLILISSLFINISANHFRNSKNIIQKLQALYKIGKKDPKFSAYFSRFNNYQRNSYNGDNGQNYKSFKFNPYYMAAALPLIKEGEQEISEQNQRVIDAYCKTIEELKVELERLGISEIRIVNPTCGSGGSSKYAGLKFIPDNPNKGNEPYEAFMFYPTTQIFVSDSTASSRAYDCYQMKVDNYVSKNIYMTRDQSVEIYVKWKDYDIVDEDLPEKNCQKIMSLERKIKRIVHCASLIEYRSIEGSKSLLRKLTNLDSSFSITGSGVFGFGPD